MIATLASLVKNPELLNEVVPGQQSFKKNSEKISEFQFNLYKYGKLQRVLVNEILPFWNYNLTLKEIWDNGKHVNGTMTVKKSLISKEPELKYSSSETNNFVGSLLEKALVKLHFNDNYKLAKYVDPVFIMSSFSNPPFEALTKADLNDLGYDLLSLMLHGKKTECLMAVSFENDVSEPRIIGNHAYTLFDFTEDSVTLYNPHGDYLTVPTNVLVENLRWLYISYTGKEIFNIPNPEYSVEYSGHWNEMNSETKATYEDYNLIVEEDETEVLVNFLRKNYNDVLRRVFVVPPDGVLNDKVKHQDELFRSSLREVLRRGEYKLRVEQTLHQYKNTPEDMYQKYSDYSERDKNEYFLRLTASKKCRVEKI